MGKQVTQRRFANPVAVVLPLLGMAACASSTPNPLAKVDDLVGWIERVHVEAELARQAAGTAVEKLQILTSPEFRGDPLVAYAEFTAAIDHSEQQAEALTASIEPMKAAAGPVFDKWAATLANFSNEQLRARSESRFMFTRESYEAVVAAVEPARDAYVQLNTTLRDHALFLGFDFNASALGALQEDVAVLNHSASELDRWLDQSMVAARAYIESAALPMRVEAARAPR
ncbi:MAG: DUF2959 family protein [Planctomycetota bacterium]